MVQQIMALQILTIDALRDVVTAVCEKALAEPGFCAIYADFCVKLSPKLPTFESDVDEVSGAILRIVTEETKSEPSAPGTKRITQTFRRLLLNTCQREFEKDEAKVRVHIAFVFATAAGCVLLL